MKNPCKKIVIIGGGPAGLTAGLSFLQKSTEIPFDLEIIILESEQQLGGLSRTHNYKGNRMDIGGHRFFSKSDEVMQWWLDLMPIEIQADLASPEKTEKITINYQGKSREIEWAKTGVRPELQVVEGNSNGVSEGNAIGVVEGNSNEVVEGNSNGVSEGNAIGVVEGNSSDVVEGKMLVRSRLSRIFYLRKFFKYPISLSWQTLKNLGVVRVIRVGMSYCQARIFPIKPENNLEEFFINRFGKELYRTFFQSYTEKVWGVKCSEISAEWGAQRIKGLSITEAIKHALFKNKSGDVSQKNIETSLIEKFLYPEFGPGQMWELVGKKIRESGGCIYLGARVNSVKLEGSQVREIEYLNQLGEQQRITDIDYLLSSMPIQQLIDGMEGIVVPESVKEVSKGLIYRDFITVGLLIRKFKNQAELKDNWIYIQESDVRVGRLQIFNNWSPKLVKNAEHYWIGLEYFCQQNDDLWLKTDEEMVEFAMSELIQLDLVERQDILDGTSLKVPKTYPAYFGSYNRFDEITEFIDGISNLYPIGRNGMHRYNNQDHSMLTAFRTVESILFGSVQKKSIWEINTEMEYHEEK